MASKQLGKLRQWAGEKISSDKRTIATDAFRDLETEVERRRNGMEQVYEHSQAFYRYLTKKKETGDGEQKVLPIEMMGRVMIAHGEEFGSDSAYGHSLTALGNVHVSVANFQDQFAESFHATFLTRLEACLAEVAQYYVLRKKLKSRRLAYDAAVSQAQKQFKKEKEKSDAEEEVIRARTRFEEMSSEVQVQMEKIQDGEMDQFRDLGCLLDMELKFAEGWVNALREAKDDWPTEGEVYRVTPNRPKGPTHIMRPTTPVEQPVADAAENSDDSEPPRRPVQHQRSVSAATTGSQGRKSSMSNWASVAVGSLLRKEKSGDFEQLKGDDAAAEGASASRSQSETPVPLTRTRSGRVAPPPPRPRAQSSLSETHSSKHSSPRLPPRSLPLSDKPPQKIMRALYAFNGGTDELTIDVGDEILVLAEPSETWWKGECKGKIGLFPVTYTEEAPKKPPLPARPSALARSSQPSPPLQEFPILRSRSNSASVRRLASEDEPFGDHHSALTPIAHSPDYRQTSYSGGTEDEDDDERGLVNRAREEGGAWNGASSAHAGVVRQLSRSLSAKKAPPPPPPSRRTNSTSIHRLSSSAGNSATASPFLTPKNPDPNWGSKAPSAVKSPFDEGDPYGGVDDGDVTSLSDLSLSHKCRVCDCDDFQQSLFKNDGFCNSCFHSHTA